MSWLRRGNERFDGAPMAHRLDQVMADTELADKGRLMAERGIVHFRGFQPVEVDLLADWGSDPFSHRSWQWHAASFNFMPWLVAYYARKGMATPDLALAAVASWRRAEEGLLESFEFARHDHATALRTEHALLLLAYLHLAGGCRRDRADLAEWIDRLAGLLEDEAFYARGTNHGIEQARTLAQAAYMLPDRRASRRRWRLALDRLRAELDFAFAADGVHVENSPGYHVFACNAFQKVATMFPRERLGGLGEAIDAVLPGAMAFLAHVLRPDGRLPIIGDTEASKVPEFPDGRATRERAWLEHARTAGVEGRAPRNSIAVFPDSGYVVVRDRWRQPAGFRRSMHLVMKCGYLSRYHRHDDDFNIVLYWGEDWLVDGGAYAYIEDSEVRRYLRSKWAHNVPVVDLPGERWPALRCTTGNATMHAVVGRDGGLEVRASSDAYPGYQSSRELRMPRSRKRFVVEDRIVPAGEYAAPALFRSLWHVPADKDILRRNQSILVVSRRQRRALRIRPMSGEAFGAVSEFVPTIEGRRGAVSSPRRGELADVRTLSFARRGSSFHAMLRFDLLESFDTRGWQPL
jgi:hypothetical protein